VANDLGHSRGGFSTKIHAVVDAKGRPLHLELTPGQQHEATVAESLLEHAQGAAFIGDTGYDAEHIRVAIAARGMKAVIPSHPTRAVVHLYDKTLYRIRYRIECFFHTLKRCRRIATRYEKTARNYLALVHLACALIWSA
jgi:transposase